MDSLGMLAGIRVIESTALPLDPSPGAHARRIVRHGLADVLAWLGEEVGPKPGEQTHVLMIGHDLHASAAIIGQLRDDGHSGGRIGCNHAGGRCNETPDGRWP